MRCTTPKPSETKTSARAASSARLVSASWEPTADDLEEHKVASAQKSYVGENGRGKSTLLHVLSGALTPDSGVVQRLGTVGIAEQEMPTGGNRTVGQAVAEAIAQPLAAVAAQPVAPLNEVIAPHEAFPDDGSLRDRLVSAVRAQAERDEVHELTLLGPNPDVTVPQRRPDDE